MEEAVGVIETVANESWVAWARCLVPNIANQAREEAERKAREEEKERVRSEEATKVRQA